jgi:hypothetical protein
MAPIEKDAAIMSDWKQTAAERNAAIDEYLSTLRLHYVAQFVPFSLSRNAKSAPKLSELSLNWRVTIGKLSPLDGQVQRDPLVTDYQEGIAHIPEYMHGMRPTIHHVDCVRHSCEKGTRYVDSSSGVIQGRKLDAPALRDILYYLIQDASAIDCSTFEDWANDLGMDTDSRKAEAAYRACIETGLKLRQIIGDAALTKLRELFQDY